MWILCVCVCVCVCVMFLSKAWDFQYMLIYAPKDCKGEIHKLLFHMYL